jgi:hypothetical protein
MAVVREWVRRDSGGVRVAGEAWVLGDAIAHFVFLGFVFWEREGRGEDGLFMGFDYSWSQQEVCYLSYRLCLHVSLLLGYNIFY